MTSCPSRVASTRLGTTVRAQCIFWVYLMILSQPNNFIVLRSMMISKQQTTYFIRLSFPSESLLIHHTTRYFTLHKISYINSSNDGNSDCISEFRA
jgi:hypothetical protein